MRYLFAHAHPDDESLASGTLIAHLLAEGNEVFVLTGTRGERGEIVQGTLPGSAGIDEIVAHREGELAAALNCLGVTGSEFLGAPGRIYQDSGMAWIAPDLAGPAADTDHRALSLAPLSEVVADLVEYATHIAADVIVSYDSDGGYGHPDHIRMHEAAVKAAERLGVPFEALVYAPGDGIQWFDLRDLLPAAAAALDCHRSQLTVEGDHIVHVGGQREAIQLEIGLRRY